MPKTAISSSSAVEEKVNMVRSESKPAFRTEVDKRQTDMKLYESEPIEEQQAYKDVLNIDPALAHDTDVRIRDALGNTEIEEWTGSDALQTNISHVPTDLGHMPAFAQQVSYANITGSSASDSAQRRRARTLFKKYGLDVELGSINESNENSNSNNGGQKMEEDRQSNCCSNIDGNNRVAEATVSLDNDNNTDTKNNSKAEKLRVERIKKPILIRIKRRCHHCQTVFGTGDHCEECNHQKCIECPRSPVPGSITHKQDIDSTHNPGAAISQEMRRTRAAAGSSKKGVTRAVTKWLDDMEPRVEGTSRMLEGYRQAQMHSDFTSNADLSYSSSVSVPEKKNKKKKKIKRRKKKAQLTDNGGNDSQKPIQPHLDVKTRSTSRTHGPTIVVPLPPELQYIPSNFRSKSEPKAKESHETRAADDNGISGPVSQSEVCHACLETVIPTLTSICPKCQHIRCEDCPKSSSLHIAGALENNDMTATAVTAAAASSMSPIHYSQAERWYQQRHHQSPEQNPGDEYAQYLQDLVLAHRQRQRQRVYKKPRVRVRWACDLCFSAFDPKSKVCVGCGHGRCKNCIRDPERRKLRLPDPDVVQALEARLASIMLHESHMS